MLYGALAAVSYLVVLQCELRLGYSAAQAGAVLIPESVVFLALAPISGALVARLGPRWLMVTGILAVAAAFFRLSGAHPGEGYVSAILPGALLWGLGIGVAVTPLTASVLAAAPDADLGEASAINDAASRVGGVIVIALVPVLIGASGGRSLGLALAHGYQPAMIVMGGLALAAALVTGLVVSNDRAAARAVPASPRLRLACLRPGRDTVMGREPELLGQTVVVLGGSAGIGLETARRARAEGADVIVTGHREFDGIMVPDGSPALDSVLDRRRRHRPHLQLGENPCAPTSSPAGPSPTTS